MLQVFFLILTILKIIGIILAVVLSILFLVLLLLLFVPIRYQAYVSKRETFQAKGKITWLLRLLCVPVVFQNGKPSVKIQVFGITIKKVTGEEKDTTGRKEEVQRAQERPVSKAKDREIEEADTWTEEKVPAREERTQEEKLQDKTEDEAQKEFVPEDETEKGQGKTGKIKSFFLKIISRIKSLWNRLLNILKKIRNLKYTFQKFCVKIKRIRKKIQDVKDFITDERTLAAVRMCLGQLQVLLKSILPKKVRGELHFGTKDPALTGQILGGISIFYPIFMDNVKVIPDFEQSCLDGELFIKGKLRLVTAARIAWKLWRDKNIRYVYRKVSR